MASLCAVVLATCKSTTIWPIEGISGLRKFLLLQPRPEEGSDPLTALPPVRLAAPEAGRPGARRRRAAAAEAEEELRRGGAVMLLITPVLHPPRRSARFAPFLSRRICGADHVPRPGSAPLAGSIRTTTRRTIRVFAVFVLGPPHRRLLREGNPANRRAGSGVSLLRTARLIVLGVCPRPILF